MKIRLISFLIAGVAWFVVIDASAQPDSSISESASQSMDVTLTHWSTNAKVFWGRESGSWDKNSFDDAALDTSKLIISRGDIYGLITLSTSVTTFGFENEWNLGLGSLTRGDDLVVIDLGIGGLFGSIPKTSVVNQVAQVSYFSTKAGHPLNQGTATYTYSIQGSYVGATIPLMLEWRYGINPFSFNGRVGMLYHIVSVTADRKFSAYGFPGDYDVSLNEGRFTYFNDNTMIESFNHKVSQLVIAASPVVGISMRLPLTSQTADGDGFGIILGADLGAVSRLYVAVSY